MDGPGTSQCRADGIEQQSAGSGARILDRLAGEAGYANMQSRQIKIRHGSPQWRAEAQIRGADRHRHGGAKAPTMQPTRRPAGQ